MKNKVKVYQAGYALFNPGTGAADWRFVGRGKNITEAKKNLFAQVNAEYPDPALREEVLSKYRYEEGFYEENANA